MFKSYRKGILGLREETHDSVEDLWGAIQVVLCVCIAGVVIELVLAAMYCNRVCIFAIA